MELVSLTMEPGNRAPENAANNRAAENAANNRAAENTTNNRAPENAANNRAAENATNNRAAENATNNRAPENAANNRAAENATNNRAPENATNNRAAENATNNRIDQESTSQMSEYSSRNSSQHPPITKQPGKQQEGNFMPAPAPMRGCPAGLEYLASLDQVVIKQDMSVLEVFTGFDALNSYTMFNSLGQQIYKAGEESNCCLRQCCGTQRGFVYHVLDNFNQEVFTVNRDFNCIAGKRSWPCDCCRYYADVLDAQGRRLGYVSDRFTCCACCPYFGIYDESQNLTAEIRGPFWDCQNVCCSCDIEFPVYDVKRGGGHFGMISKTWEGALKNCCTSYDNFLVRFPIDLEVKTKVLMISAVLIIDMMMYELQEGGDKGLTE